LFSRRLLESSANADIVVSEPQNPTAAKREYRPSRCHCCDIMTNAPRINAPITLTIKTLTGNVLKSKGDSVTLNLRYAPSTEPTARKTNSKPFIYILTQTDIISAILENLGSIHVNLIINLKTDSMIFICSILVSDKMNLKLRCEDYGFECEFVLDEEKSIEELKKFRDHFEEEHGIDYTIEAVTQMITNRGHSLESIKK